MLGSRFINALNLDGGFRQAIPKTNLSKLVAERKRRTTVTHKRGQTKPKLHKKKPVPKKKISKSSKPSRSKRVRVPVIVQPPKQRKPRPTKGRLQKRKSRSKKTSNEYI